jgi:hypothetical protein
MQRYLVAASLMIATAACNNALSVDNPNNPDIGRVFSAGPTIEQTIGTGYQQCRNALHTTSGNPLYIQLETMSFESYSQLNNFFMGPRGALPRAPILNNRSSSSVFTEYSSLSRQARVISNAVTALDSAVKDGGTLGSPAQDLRARAFGFFVVACNLGNLALAYDSAGIVYPGYSTNGDSIPELSPYKEVMAKAIQLLDTAVAVASNSAATGTGGFPTPASWMSNAALSRDDFVRLVRSYRARFRAEVARTPADRAAVDWNAVIADATNGLQSDLVVSIGGSTGWNIGFEGNQMHVDAGWSQITPMIFGMADVSGGYDDWLSKPLLQRDYFLIVSPDKRWPQGTTRKAQQDASPIPSGYTSYPYVANRTAQDTPGDPWGTSFYNFHRFRYIQRGSNRGDFPEFLKAEVDLLAAEGYLRTGNIAAAAAKIDITRTKAGLPALSGVVTSLTQPVPGGTSCVPRVPQAPAYTSTACGTIFEAMKWEKRMETAFQAFGAWFFDSRGWGDLPQNTALEYPVPFQELDARGHPFYDLGGGGLMSAAKGNYGI